MKLRMENGNKKSTRKFAELQTKTKTKLMYNFLKKQPLIYGAFEYSRSDFQNLFDDMNMKRCIYFNHN
jgi:hypothetical protein